MRWTELTLIPVALAMAGAVQWVVPPRESGRGRAPPCSALSSGSGGIRDGRVLSPRRPSTPSCMKRSCQRQTAVLANRLAHDLSSADTIGGQQNDFRTPNALLPAIAVRADTKQAVAVTGG